MTLPKFAARRIHQVRANKSYLKAQTDWSNQDQDQKCQRCEEESETMSHIIKCPALEGAQMNINLKALNIAPESPLWKSNMKGMELIWPFSSYVIVTGLFLFNENTIEPAIDLLVELVLREASRDRR